MAIWSSSPSVPAAVEATQRALIRLERWSEYWCLPLNPRKCEAFFSVDCHQANLQPHLLFHPPLRFNPTPTFHGVIFDRILSFSKHVSLLKVNSSLVSRFMYLCFLMGLFKESFLFCIKLLLGPFSLMLHSDGFLFIALATLPNGNAFIERSVTPSLADSSFPIPFLTEESLPPLQVTLLISLYHFAYERALRLQPSFPILGFARRVVKLRLCRSSWRAFASTYLLMLTLTFSREVLFACPPWTPSSFTMESTFSFPCFRSDYSFSHQGAALAHHDSPTLPSGDLE